MTGLRPQLGLGVNPYVIGRPILTLRLTSGALDSRVTASGATNGTRITSAGLVATGTAPRFNHTVAGVARGLLLEGARTNVITYSDDFSNAAWTKTNVTAAIADVVSPDGTSNAYTLTGGTGTKLVHLVHVGTASVPYSFSLWVRRRTGTGLVAMTNTDGGYIQIGALLTSSWQRFEVKTASSGSTTIRAYLRIYTTGDEIDVWGAQLEQATDKGSEIYTAGSTVTRTADSLTMTGTNFSDWYNAASGTFTVDFTSPAVGTCGILSVHDGTANEVIELYTDGTNLKLSIVDGGVSQAAITVGTVTAGQSHTCVFSYLANNFAASLDGATVVTDTSGTLPTVDRAALGSTQAGEALYGHISRMTYYRAALL